MTYRERRLAKAERLRGWADKRQVAAEADLESQPELRHDWAFITQPGHIPARARMNARDDRAYASLQKAGEMSSRADSIEAAADGAIYSDDEDAIERLEERIAGLEAERDRIKAYNASARKAKANHGDLSILTEREQKTLLRAIGTWGDVQCKHGVFPSYHLTNLSGNLNRQKKRLEALRSKRR